MVGKSSDKEESLFSFVMRRMLLIIGKSNRAFRKLGGGLLKIRKAPCIALFVVLKKAGMR